MRPLIAVAILAELFATCGPQRLHAETAAARFCVLPVKNGEPTEAEIGQTWRISSDNFRIPGLPAIVFTPTSRHVWLTIDAERRLVPYTGPYPHSYLDKNKWVLEPWSSRVVAITWGGGVSVLRPGTNHFEEFEGTAFPRGGNFNSIQLLPRRKLTVVASGKGIPFVVEENSLRPWLSKEELAAHGIRGIFTLHESPSLAATVIRDFDSRIHLLTDDGRWLEVGVLENRDYGPVFDALDAGATLVLGTKSVILIRKNSGTLATYSAERLLTTDANGAGMRYSTSRLFHQILIYDTGGGFFDFHSRWRRLGTHGFEDVPGGNTGIPPSTFSPYGRIQDLPTLGKTLFEGKDGFFLYDGHSITPVTGASRARIGELPRVYDLPSIKRVVLSTRNGMFELSADGKLIERPMPFPTNGLPQAALKDWPESKVALISTRDGLFVLDANLQASPVTNGKLVDLSFLGFANGTNPGTGEMVLTAKRSLYLAVDSLRSPEACRQARD
jgi:hypothetical protein